MKQAWIFETVQYIQRTLVYVPDDYNEQKVKSSNIFYKLNKT